MFESGRQVFHGGKGSLGHLSSKRLDHAHCMMMSVPGDERDGSVLSQEVT